jgi:hypothetical protein
MAEAGHRKESECFDVTGEDVFVVSGKEGELGEDFGSEEFGIGGVRLGETDTVCAVKDEQ